MPSIKITFFSTAYNAINFQEHITSDSCQFWACNNEARKRHIVQSRGIFGKISLDGTDGPFHEISLSRVTSLPGNSTFTTTKTLTELWIESVISCNVWVLRTTNFSGRTLSTKPMVALHVSGLSDYLTQAQWLVSRRISLSPVGYLKVDRTGWEVPFPAI